MGMLPTLGVQWAKFRHAAITGAANASDGASIYSNAIRMVRMGMQILIVGIGAWLVIQGKIGPGVLFANMILSARALPPIERVVGSWNGLVARAAGL